MEVKRIGLFGRRNVGKSSLINLLFGEEVSIVSSHAGTTTDPIKKRLEIFGVGAVQLIDTAGVDDVGELGLMRVEKSREVISQIDLAIVLFSGSTFGNYEREIIGELNLYNTPFILLHNQSDILELSGSIKHKLESEFATKIVEFSCVLLDENRQSELVKSLLDLIVTLLKKEERTIMQGLVNEGDLIVLVCPIDNGAPTGRMILPQVMAIRDILDNKGVAVVLQPENLEQYLKTATPKLVVTDSQVFKQVANVVPPTTHLTSFSMLLARSKGPYEAYIKGVKQISNLKDGDSVLILESCSHATSCDDIGRVKLPKMLHSFTGLKEGSLKITFVQGLDKLPCESFSLAIQCGGCMVTSKQLNNRVAKLINRGVSVTNYGIAIAYMSGILSRVSNI